ncbi:MAG: cysteine--tRNA ligase [Deltaproteobacteria bacterium]|nr:cysteine--tRNA ligase [Deltaproteobacteria bacterium]
MEIVFFNTLGREYQRFEPLEDVVKIYCCGPTVYHFAHLGNFRSYIFEDILVRFLRKSGFSVKHVMNITDVGHLVSDADEGEDKMVLAAKREKKDVLEIARFYSDVFFDDARKLNILKPDIVCRATEHIPQMISLIKKLEARGFTYFAGGNVYFDTSKFPDYSKLRAGQDKSSVARVEEDPNKKNQEDFVLWFTKSKYRDHILLWDSPWGLGYPGWHIECSAMAMTHLGETLDIHCGGVDHIPIHHTNEIAQSECATGKLFSRFWLHNEFVLFNNDKMSKSKGSIVTVSDIDSKGFDPLDYRYLCLLVHYRTQLNFTEETLKSARTARQNLVLTLAKFLAENRLSVSQIESTSSFKYLSTVAEDLNTPKLLGQIWTDIENLTVDTVSSILEIDEVLGLNLKSKIILCSTLDTQAQEIAAQREISRKNKRFEESDKLRDVLTEKGYLVFDTNQGQIVLNRNI